MIAYMSVSPRRAGSPTTDDGGRRRTYFRVLATRFA
jgi:hypothetical protein